MKNSQRCLSNLGHEGLPDILGFGPKGKPSSMKSSKLAISKMMLGSFTEFRETKRRGSNKKRLQEST